MLELKNITKHYNPGTVNELCLFEHFNLVIPDRQFMSVVGSNGSGKPSMPAAVSRTSSAPIKMCPKSCPSSV